MKLIRKIVFTIEEHKIDCPILMISINLEASKIELTLMINELPTEHLNRKLAAFSAAFAEKINNSVGKTFFVEVKSDVVDYLRFRDSEPDGKTLTWDACLRPLIDAFPSLRVTFPQGEMILSREEEVKA